MTDEAAPHPGHLPEFPPVRLVSVYAAHVEPVDKPVPLIEGDGFAAVIRPGGFELRATIEQRFVSANGMAFTPQTVRIPIPSGTCVVFFQFVPAPTAFGERAEAALAFARLAGLVEIAHPGVLAHHIYEGPAEREGEMFVWPEHGMRAHATAPRTAEQITEALLAGLKALESLSDQDFDRFGLASRLLMRAAEVESPIDRLLALWTVLEIHTRADTKVVQAVTRLLSDETGVPKETVKATLMIGETYGYRKDIVHRGMAFVPPDQDTRFNHCVERLEAIVIFCMRRLAGVPGGTVLAEYLGTAPGTSPGSQGVSSAQASESPAAPGGANAPPLSP